MNKVILLIIKFVGFQYEELQSVRSQDIHEQHNCDFDLNLCPMKMSKD